MSEYRLEMRGVCQSFPGVKALDHAQLCLRPGTVLNAHIGQSHAAVDVAVKALNGEAMDNYYWVDYVKVDAAYFG